MHEILIAANATTKPYRREENKQRYADTAIMTATLPYLHSLKRGSGWVANRRLERSQPSVVGVCCESFTLDPVLSYPSFRVLYVLRLEDKGWRIRFKAIRMQEV